MSSGDPWLAVQSVYPASSGCNRGRTFSAPELVLRTEHTILGEFASEARAVRCLRSARQAHENFEDWADEMYGHGEDEESDQPPPWDSAEGRNYDNDDEVLLDVMRKSEFEAARAEDEQLLERARAGAIADAARTRAAKQQRLSASGHVHYDFPGPPWGVDKPAVPWLP
jgi:hypothetical protein